jgi:hypothetical protein
VILISHTKIRLSFLRKFGCQLLLTFFSLSFLRAADSATPEKQKAIQASNPFSADVLVYNNGDRLEGRLISNDGKMIVFFTTRFGELHVPATEAKVTTTMAANSTSPKTAASTTLDEQALLKFGRVIRGFMGPWHGRVAVSSETVHDTTLRRSDTVDGKMERKWTDDEIRLGARYDYGSTDNITSTEVAKTNFYWRHELTARYFTIYRPSFEWNRYYQINGVTQSYQLFQNEAGVGVTLLNEPRRKLRVGTSATEYEIWTSNEPRVTRFVPSLFIESEFNLPWKMKFVGRGSRYFSLRHGQAGWESQVELSKKLTETFLISLHYDTRFNTPDIHVQDYSTWRLLLGLDF